MSALSIWQIDLITTHGGSHRLLDYGDEMLDPVEMSVEQQTSSFTAIGAAWGGASADGGARRSIAWSRMVAHASHAAAYTYCQVFQATFPFACPGRLRISIQGGPVFDHLDAIVTAIPTSPALNTSGFDTNSMFRATAGKMVPVSGLPLTPGLPISWQLTPIGSINTPAIGSL